MTTPEEQPNSQTGYGNTLPSRDSVFEQPLVREVAEEGGGYVRYTRTGSGWEVMIVDLEEAKLVEDLKTNGNVAVLLFNAPTYVESLDKTSAYVRQVLARHDLERIDGKTVVTNARYTEELGHHIWARVFNND